MLKWLVAQSTTPPKFWTGNMAPETLKQKIMLQFVKTFKVEFPVWIDGVKTDAKETRIKLLFKQTDTFKGITRTTVGSAVIQKDWTEEDVLDNYNTEEDLSDVLMMLPVEGSDFCKVVPR